MADQIVTNSGNGNGGLYFIVGGILVAVVVVIALFSGVFSPNNPNTATAPSKQIDITVTPKAPAPTAPAPTR